MAGDAGAFPEPICYTDSYWSGKKGASKSTGGYVFILGGGAVSLTNKEVECGGPILDRGRVHHII